MLRVTFVFIFLAIVTAPIKGQLQPGDEGGSKCGSCPCGNPCPSSPPPPSYPSPPPPSYPSPPPPSPPPPTPVLPIPPPTPKAPPSSYCPPPPASVPSGPIYPSTPLTPSIYFTAPPGQLYPIDQNSAAATVNIMGFAVVGLMVLIGNVVLLDFWWK